ncbi:hypothetical protein ES288_D10G141800v1 [Gossypium darwinii]|uniref:Rx N-terminal domain-containing protein n=1 Tax=Gossypium darwinii TaxID=34276 RepID=A0A5D2AYJ4_GOSDA|nr:hypothetical protein ES288_D10G141800v1 [Gossypium darwinii]
MAEAVICIALEVELSRAVSIIEDQINLAWDFKDELNKFRSSLTLTRAFLQDAERRQLDEPVKVWLEQLRDIAYEADDMLDELAYEHVRWKVDNQMSKKVCNFLSLSKNPMAFTLKMFKKVKNIDLSIKDINRQVTDFGLQQRLQISSLVSSRVGGGTRSFGHSSRVVGREANVLKIVDLLIGSTIHQILSITSIVGMAGLGKTCMLESLSGRTRDMKNKNAILEIIQNELEGKTYLLVLDDVWDKDIKNWEKLHSCVPLVAIVIEGKLCNKRDRDEWVSLRDSSVWGSLEMNKGIVGVLKLSFNHLSFPFLKQCFTYYVEKDSYGRFTSCKMHNLVHDLGQSVSHIKQQNEFDGVKLWRSLLLNSGFTLIRKNFKGLRVLKFGGAYIVSLPDSIGELKHLRYFDISKTCIRRLPEPIESWRLALPIFDVGKENGSGIKELGCLVELGDELVIYNLQNVRNIEEARAAKLIENYMGEYYPSWLLVSKTVGDPCASFQPMNSVELKLSRCMNLKHLLTLGQYPNLKFLEIRVLTSVRCIGNEFYGNNNNGDEKNQPITLFLVLEVFTQKNMKNVTEWLEAQPKVIEGGLSADTSLETLEIERSRMISIPSLDGFSSLVELKLINCQGLTSLPNGSSTCTSLGCLSIRNCTSLESISEDVGQLHSLEELFIYRCQNLKKIPKESLGCLTRLKSLLDKLCSLPNQIQHLTALRQLCIYDFNGLKALPEWLGNLSSLEILHFEGCENLRQLPYKATPLPFAFVLYPQLSAII